MFWYRQECNVWILRLYIQPGAKQNAIIGLIQGELKVKLHVPPIEGRANVALIKFLAELFKVPRSSIVLKSGEKTRHKTVAISNSLVHPDTIFSVL